jgi:hypothetical protein
VLRVEITEAEGRVVITPWVDAAARQQGRPRVRTQREDCRPELTQLAEAPCTSRK